MADQCIVCLDNLDVHDSGHTHGISITPPSESNPTIGALNPEVTPSPTLTLNLKTNDSNTINVVATSPRNDEDDEDTRIAVIQVCGHVLHDACLREWTGKANSCPICRQTFHLVHVYDKVGGTSICSYKVEDKKQVAEFDPQAWLDENPEEEGESLPCPICNSADQEEVLLLCDNCDTPYHTHCVGLDAVPRGHWFCLECADEAAQLLAAELDEPDVLAGGLSGFSDGRSDYLPRTQATMRRARRRARSDEWQGAWGQIAGHVWDVLNIDLDNHDDDESLHNYRRSQQRRERERREYQRWQQRLNIASRLGAHDVFAENLSRVIPQRMVRPPPPPPPQETPEEAQAWGALEKAMEAESPNRPTTSHRKRKSRSVTASPAEPPAPQERRLKRPRTRRVPTQSEGSSSNPVSTTQGAQSTSATTSSSNGRAGSPLPVVEGPTFLSSLLKEVEMSTPSDDENIQMLFARTRPSTDPISPITSPSPSAHSSPRALSTTPPPRSLNERPGSPLSLMSRIEPVYPPANFNACPKNNGDHSDSESRSRQQHSHHGSEATTYTTEIRQPRPRRQRHSEVGTAMTRSSDVSPSRLVLPFEMKESISGIVKDALKPHWKSGQLTAEQYSKINRELSHKLYREVSEQELDDQARSRFEKIASKEVARAVEHLKA
ncbi:hypothetical protein F5Y18DRAFT_235401 [Xylariaceae sp. FL1019]|nr:hypothetical protein F5Y18DRAFT_235401 [Xylariaceae sp. FL1019]